MSKRKADRDLGGRLKTSRANEPEDLLNTMNKLESAISASQTVHPQLESEKEKLVTMRRILQYLNHPSNPESILAPEPLWTPAGARGASASAPSAGVVGPRVIPAAPKAAGAGAGVMPPTATAGGDAKQQRQQLAIVLPENIKFTQQQNFLSKFEMRRLNNTLDRAATSGQMYFNYRVPFVPVRLLPDSEKTKATQERMQFAKQLLAMLQRVKSVDFHTEFIRRVPNMSIEDAKFGESDIQEITVEPYITMQLLQRDPQQPSELESVFQIFPVADLSQDLLFELLELIDPTSPRFTITLILQPTPQQQQILELIDKRDYNIKLRVVILDAITFSKPIGSTKTDIVVYPMDSNWEQSFDLPVLNYFTWNLVKYKGQLFAFEGSFGSQTGNTRPTIFPATWKELEQLFILDDSTNRINAINIAVYNTQKRWTILTTNLPKHGK